MLQLLKRLYIDDGTKFEDTIQYDELVCVLDIIHDCDRHCFLSLVRECCSNEKYEFMKEWLKRNVQ